MTTYLSIFPSLGSSYVFSTTELSYKYGAHYAAKNVSNTGVSEYTSWFASDGSITNQRINIRYDSSWTPHVFTRLWIENAHNSGEDTEIGIRNVLVYGSNDESITSVTDYADTTNLTLLATIEVAQHVGSDSADPQYFELSNPASYKVMVLRIADCWGSTDFMAIRRFVFQISLQEVSHTMDGGIVFGGNALTSIPVTVSHTMDGGIILGGSASFDTVVVYNFEGDIVRPLSYIESTLIIDKLFKVELTRKHGDLHAELGYWCDIVRPIGKIESTLLVGSLFNIDINRKKGIIESTLNTGLSGFQVNIVRKVAKMEFHLEIPKTDTLLEYIP